MTREELLAEIREITPTLDGWCTPERACDLAKAVLDLNSAHPSTCLGVWGGRDTFPLAMAHRLLGKGHVLAVDPWHANASIEGQVDKANVDWWNDQAKHDLVYARFIANVARLGLSDWIKVMKMRGSEAIPPDKISVLVVDGNHGPESVADVNKWAPHVIDRGIVYLDDLDWSGGAVRLAEKRVLEMGFHGIFQRDTGAFFQRTDCI